MTSQSTVHERTNKSIPGYFEEGTAFADMAGFTLGAPSVKEPKTEPERVKVIVIGGGQAGLSVGYHLKRLGVPFLILDASARVGDVWRARWDSLRLFTPARYDSLDGMPFPAHPRAFPTKNEMADYLESYAATFQLPIRHCVKVDGLTREGDRYIVTAGKSRFEAEHVVVAMGNYQAPRVPSFAKELSPDIVQIHSSEYRNPSQLKDGDVLLVGAGNSGSEIAVELAKRHQVWMSGRDTGHIPFRIDGFLGRHVLVHLVLRVVFHRILTLNTPLGRKVRPTIISHGGPLIRVKPKQLAAAGVERLGKTIGVKDGLPVFADGRVLDVANVIWCTGFDAGFSWIRLPVFHDDGEPIQTRGIVPSEPGLYFVGLHFLHSFSSTMIHGVGRDARYVAQEIAHRARATAMRPAQRFVEATAA